MAGEEMKGMGLKRVAILGLLVLGAAVAVPATQANPPFASATYAGTTSEGLPIVLVVNSAGNALAAGSYVEFTCTTASATYTAIRDLSGTQLLLPAGLTNVLGTGVNASMPGFEGGTLSWRFFGRFFASTAGAGGQTQPPGDLATGDFSGRNVTGIPGGVGFCSFRVTWNAAKLP
jgi:hypothetical protein